MFALHGGRCPQRASALATESKAKGIHKAALRASRTEWDSTLATEVHPFWILKPTTRALHAACLLLWGLRGKESIYARTVKLRSSALAQPRLWYGCINRSACEFMRDTQEEGTALEAAPSYMVQN
jgi:hypothetical protein